MKARFMTKTALSALALAFAGALPGVWLSKLLLRQPFRLLIRLKPLLLKRLL